MRSCSAVALMDATTVTEETSTENEVAEVADLTESKTKFMVAALKAMDLDCNCPSKLVMKFRRYLGYAGAWGRCVRCKRWCMIKC